MRLDIVTIFPDYFAPLQLSLIGKAISDGLLDVRVHDLRDWTHDRHRTVDDTPYGGGAGMVMKPEPWGEALDELLASYRASEADADSQSLPAARPILIVPSPAGHLFSQSMAAEFAVAQTLAFACGRYEGIDRRVVEWASGSFDVREVSLGDYVLNGGEVAALAMIEAIVRLIPGVIGNPESLLEESHSVGSQGLLEYPVYTKPALWRGLQVPDVLLSGHHGRVEQWRRERSRMITEDRRPDLLQ